MSFGLTDGGQMRKSRYTEPEVTMASDPDPVCPLCLRPIPPDVPQSRHHLIPKLRGGKGGPTVLLHHICHKTIHKTLRETELARNVNTVEALRTHPDLAPFWAWIARRPPGFSGKTR
jgi:hypothetical protein